MARRNRRANCNRNGSFDISAATNYSHWRERAKRKESRAASDARQRRAVRSSLKDESARASRRAARRSSPRSSRTPHLSRGRSRSVAAACAVASPSQLVRTASKESTGPMHPESKQYSRANVQDKYKARNGMSGAKRAVLAVVCALAVILVGCGVAAGMWYTNIANNLKGNGSISNMVSATAGEPYYVLLLGGDSRTDSKKNNRTDSIMVARVDESEKQVTLVSIPRDLRVNIDGHGYCKINSAIEYGGYDQTVSIVNNVLGIQINYYAFIYFSGFKDLVDELGGVTVDVPAGTYYHGTWVTAGDNVEINGTEALVLARCRHGNPPDQGAYAMGDYQRTLNQRNLIKAIAKKVLKQKASKLPSLISSLSECVETNMSIEQLATMAANMKGMDTESIDAAQLPIAGATINGAWYAIMYEDVFEVMASNFRNGRDPYHNLANFDTEYDDSDVGSSYTDGEVYSYTSYADFYGEFRG